MRPGTIVIWVGVAIAVVGAVIRFAPWLVSWFGSLPGDIRHEGDRTTVFVPITSMIIVSVLASAVVALIRRWGS